MRTWKEGEKDGQNVGAVESRHYEKAGKLEAALSIHAEEALAQANPDLSRRIFQALTKIDSSNRQIRRPARLSELESLTGASRSQILELLELFRADGRNFLVWKEKPAGDKDLYDPVVDISHESLIRRWKRLENWVRDEAEDAARLIQLVGEARSGGGKSLPLRDPTLQLMLDWRDTRRPTAAWAQRYTNEFEEAIRFLEVSRERRDREIEREKRRQQERLEQAQELAALRFRELEQAQELTALRSRELEQAQDVAALRSRELSARKKAVAVLLAAASGFFALFLQFCSLTRYHQQLTRAEEALEKNPQSSIRDAVASLSMYDDSLSIYDDSRAENFLRRALERLPGTFVDPCSLSVEEPVAGLAGPLSFSETARWPDRHRIAIGLGSVATASVDKVWLAESSSPTEKMLEQLPSEITALTFSSDAQYLVAGTRNGSAVLWRFGLEPSRLKLDLSFTAPVTFVKFHGGDQIAIAHSDGRLEMWNVDGRRQHSPDSNLRVTAVAFLEPGASMVTGTVDGLVHLWDRTPDGLKKVALPGLEGEHPILAVAIGGNWIAAGDRERLRLWRRSETAEGWSGPVVPKQDAGVLGLAIGPDGRFLASVDTNGSLRRWDLHSGEANVGFHDFVEPSILLRGHDAAVSSAVFSPDGHSMYSLDVKGVVLRWELPQPDTEARNTEIASSVVEVSHDGSWLAQINEQGAASVRRLGSPSNEWLELLCALSFSGTHESPKVLAGYADGRICVWDLDGSAPSKASCLQGPRGKDSRSCDEGITKLVIRPQDGMVLASTADAKMVLLAPDGTRETLPGRSLEKGSVVSDATFSPDGRLLAVAVGNPPIARLYTMDEDEEPTEIDPASKAISSVVFSSDGRFLATASRDGKARIYDIGRDSAAVATLEGFGGPLSVVAFSPDGKRLFAGGEGVSRVWSSPFSGRTGIVLRADPGAVSDAAFVNDERLVTIGADGSDREWDLSRQGLIEQAKLRVGPLAQFKHSDSALCAGSPATKTKLSIR